MDIIVQIDILFKVIDEIQVFDKFTNCIVIWLEVKLCPHKGPFQGVNVAPFTPNFGLLFHYLHDSLSFSLI